MRPAARPIFIFISCPRDGGFRGLELLRARNVIKRNSGNPSFQKRDGIGWLGGLGWRNCPIWKASPSLRRWSSCAPSRVPPRNCSFRKPPFPRRSGGGKRDCARAFSTVTSRRLALTHAGQQLAERAAAVL